MLSGYDNFFYMDFNNPYNFIADFTLQYVVEFLILYFFQKNKDPF